MELKNLSSNWKQLQISLQQKKSSESAHDSKFSETPAATIASIKRKKSFKDITRCLVKRPRNGHTLDMGATQSVQAPASASTATHEGLHDQAAPGPVVISDRENEGLTASIEVGKYVAIDCEMVGVGPNPDKESALARVSAVNFNGDQIYDSYVRAKEQVTDWRTYVSGILPKHMTSARSLEEVQEDITKLLDGRILVGHTVRNDLSALLLSHPKRDIRDTAKHKPFRQYAGGGTPKLKILASALLGIDIQSGEHSSVEDARACMLIFRREKDAFEREHSKTWRSVNELSTVETQPSQPKKKKKKRKSKRS